MTKQTPIKIKLQGGPIVNDACIIKQSEDIVCIIVDLKSKYIECLGTFDLGNGPGICLVATENSLHLDNFKKASDTMIEFCNFVGWNVFSMYCSRYSVYVCLTKD